MNAFPPLLRASLKKDARLITGWQLVLFLMMLAGATKVHTLFATAAARATLITTMKTPAMVALVGRFSLTPTTSPASAYATMMLTFVALLVALMNVALASRPLSAPHQVQNELLRAGTTAGPLALAAAGELMLVNLLTTVVLAGALASLHLSGTTGARCALFGLGIASVGLVFGSLTLLLTNLTPGAPALIGNGLVGLAYVGRMLTDVHHPQWTGLTVLGLVEKMTSPTADHWGLIALLSAISLGILALSLPLARGTVSLLPATGRERKRLPVTGPFALVLRENGVLAICWLGGLLALGVVYGSLFGQIGDLAKTTPALAHLLGPAAIQEGSRHLIMAFTNKLAGVLASLASLAGISVMLKLNGDERRGFLEQVHALPVSRGVVYRGYLCTGMGLALLANLVGVLGLVWAGSHHLQASQLAVTRLWRILPGSLADTAVVLALTALLAAWWPRLQGLSWLVPLAGIFTTYLAPLLNLPSAVQRFTPYGWLNNVPSAPVDWGGTLAMAALAIIGVLLAGWGYQHRDLTLP